MTDLREVIARAIESRIDTEPMVDAPHSRKREIRAEWCSDAALAAIKAAGYVVVPVEPTKRQITLGYCVSEHMDSIGDDSVKEEMSRIYRAMIEAFNG